MKSAKTTPSQSPWIKTSQPLFGFDPSAEPTMTIDRTHILRIVSIDEPLVRVRAIAQAYHLLGRRIAKELGLEDYANWWDFAAWAATTIAFAIGGEAGWRPSAQKLEPTSPLVRSLIRDRTFVNERLALANLYVFEEMAMVGWRVLQKANLLWDPEHKLAEQDERYKDMRDRVLSTPRRGLFGEGRPELLRYGLDSLRLAANGNDPALRPVGTTEEQFRTNKLLLSTTAFFEYEQARLQGDLDVILSGRPYKRWLELRPLREYTGRGAERRPTGNFRRRLATEFLEMHFHDRSYSVGRKAAPLEELPPGMEQSDASYLRVWMPPDSEHDTALGKGGWTELHHRMSRTIPIFQKRMRNRFTMASPYEGDELELVVNGWDPRSPVSPEVIVDLASSDELDRMRTLGDAHEGADEQGSWPEAVDEFVRTHRHLTLDHLLGLIAWGYDPCEKQTIDDVVREMLYTIPVEYPDNNHERWISAMKNSRLFFRDHLAAVGAGLLFGVLPTDMAAAEGALVLHHAGGFRHDPSGRIDRTARFLLATMNTNLGTLFEDLSNRHRPIANEDEEGSPFVVPCFDEDAPSRLIEGDSLLQIRKTRVIHHVCRSWLKSQETGGELDVWAALPYADSEPPINVEDQLGTLFSFTVALWACLENLGVNPTDLRAARTDWYDAWLWICVNLGMPADELPASFEEAEDLAAKFAARHLRSTTASAELGRKFVDDVKQAWPPPFNLTPKFLARRIAAAAIRATSQPITEKASHPNSVADMLALPSQRWIPPRLSRAMITTIAGEGRFGIYRGVVSTAILRRQVKVNRRALDRFAIAANRRRSNKY